MQQPVETALDFLPDPESEGTDNEKGESSRDQTDSLAADTAVQLRMIEDGYIKNCR
jgi:hypothetical protein